MALVYQRLVRDIGVKSLVLHLQDIDDAWVIKGKGSEPCTEPNKFKCDDWMLPACCAQCSLWSFSALFLCRDAASHCIQLTPCLRSAGLSYFGGLLLIVLFSFICDVRWCDSVWSFTKSRCIYKKPRAACGGRRWIAQFSLRIVVLHIATLQCDAVWRFAKSLKERHRSCINGWLFNIDCKMKYKGLISIWKIQLKLSQLNSGNCGGQT